MEGLITNGLAWALAGAGLSIALAGIGTIIGTMYVASGGAGLMAKDPRQFGRVLLLAALPSSQGIYGFLGAVLILLKVGMLGGDEIIAVTDAQGYALLAAALPVGLLGLVSGIGQGRALQSGLRVVAKHPGEVGKTVILGVLLESMAVFGLLLSVLIIQFLEV